MASRIIWSEPETDLLVSERARRNEEYYFVYRGNKTGFDIQLNLDAETHLLCGKIF